MDITLAGFVLFLHITAALAGFMMAAVMHAALQALARAQTVGEMRSWARVVHRLDPLFPVVALLLLVLGAWLVHLEGDEGIGWSSGWVVTAVVTLVVVEGLSGALLAPRAKALVAKVTHAPDGAVPDDIRRASVDPYIWHLAHVATVGFLGIVFLMTVKPSGVASVVVAVVACGLGVVASMAQLRSLPTDGHAAVPDQRAGVDTPTPTGAG